MGYASCCVPTMPPVLVQRWEAVYARYGWTGPEGVAEASEDVGALWREMAAVPGCPWWLVAGLVTAAEAFDAQGREWSTWAAAQTGFFADPSRRLSGELPVRADVFSPLSGR
ncbi:hypothetical protein SAMN04487818_109332 [Actinokineospora terrae]|uniref:Uncharacterized protein n=1 Tax=Actinokineospora terrae TaxID=155974 RepID=A0A1H9W3S0_9PSEU|nr:hypothetical protein SAMN04487818_109332 [Actinokineospora terrae]